MLSKVLYGIGNLVDLIVLISFFVNVLILWFLIINNIIINYLVFGFRNIKVHVLNILVISIRILPIVCADLENATLILWLIYMVSNIVYFNKENKSIFYTICIILILFVIRIVSAIIIYGSYKEGILPYCSFIFGLTLLISNIYLSNNHLTNKYLRYTILSINVVYIIIIIYCFFVDCVMNSDIYSL